MMLLLLHGSAIEASRRKLQEVRKKFNLDNVLVFEEKADLQQVLTNLQSQSLFDGGRLIILENPPEDLSVNLSLIIHNVSLVLWFDHEVAPIKPIIKLVKDAQGEIVYFSEGREISVFPFLDYLAAKDKKAFLEIEKLKRNGFDIQYIITMAFYLLRNLASTPKKAPDFVRQKLVRQRMRFDEGKIRGLYQKILTIDFKFKSGLLEQDQAEFLLINNFMGVEAFKFLGY